MVSSAHCELRVGHRELPAGIMAAHVFSKSCKIVSVVFRSVGDDLQSVGDCLMCCVSGQVFFSGSHSTGNACSLIPKPN
jgi:hypothetical protein